MARKTLLKRVVSSFTAAAIAVVAMPVIPAFAETGATTYSFDGYDVEYSVKNEWTEGHSIEVKITNTGDEPILNWAFKYDAEGTIDGLWNASVYDMKETSYIIKNAGWNYEIAPDASVSFGYTLSDYSGINPNNFELCAKRVDKTEGYDVQYSITNEWDTGLQGEIVIINTSEEPIEFWQLSFDSDVTIDNIWNASVNKQEESHYTISSGNTPINAGESKTLGFIGTKTSELNSISAFSLSTVVVEGLGENGSIFNNVKADEDNTANNNSEESIASEKCYPYTMFAGSSDEGAITINADNFCVNGDIATNGTIVSSGNMNINGERKENAKERVISIFQKLKYSYFSGENVYSYTGDYTVDEEQILINNPILVAGSANLTGNINLKNAIQASNNIIISGNVRNAENAIIASENGDVIIDCEDFSVNGLVYAPNGNVIITAQSLNLNSAIIIANTITIKSPNINTNYNKQLASFIGVESDNDIQIFAYGEYNSDFNCIDVVWFSNYKNSEYEISISEDGEKYAVLSSAVNSNRYRYDITEAKEVIYFKVTLVTNYGETVESIPFAIKRVEGGYVLKMKDSDEDGISDFAEKALGTNPYNSDTDGDGLNDFQEYFLTNTDPKVYDSIVSGISDSDIDVDSDGISALDELNLGTNINSSDTDGDGLDDYAEVYIYKTNPLRSDTDEDTINDDDELKIGLDPLNPKTFGIPDSEYKIKQVIETDDEALSLINTIDNPYTLSIEINAAGYASNTIEAEISNYSKSLSGNTAVVGNVISLNYRNDNYDNAKLIFNIKSDYLDGIGISTVEGLGLEGINRLQAFYYDKEHNNLYPVETTTSKNSLTVNASQLGDYCIIDLNNWFEIIGIDFLDDENQDTTIERENETETDLLETTTQSVSLKYNSPNTLYSTEAVTSSAKSLKKHKVDLVYVIDTSGSMGTVLKKAKSSMYDLVRNLMLEGIDVRIAVVSYSDYIHDGDNGAKTYTIHNSNWATNPTDASDLINKVSLYGNGYETPVDGLGMAYNTFKSQFRNDASKFMVLITDEKYCYPNNRYGFNGLQEIADKLNESSIYTSVVCENDYWNIHSYEPLYKTTHGIQIDINYDWPINLEWYIRQYIKNVKTYRTVIPNSLEVISLDEPPEMYAEVDSDDDDLYDYEEIDWDYIDYSREELVLPKLGDYSLSIYGQNYFDVLPLNELQKELVNAILILPIVSNPSNADSDYDGLRDDEEYYVGTDVLFWDTDGDKLPDGIEVEEWFDPLNPNPDDDSFDDKYEYEHEMNPYVFNLSLEESAKAFTEGALLGDWVTPDNIETLLGQIATSFVPFAADARDYIANLFVNQDTWAAIMNVAGFILDLIPGAGEVTDVGKALPKLGKFVAKHSDDAAKVIMAIVESVKHFPNADDVIPGLVKILPVGSLDNIAKSVKNGNKITKIDYSNVSKVFKAASETMDFGSDLKPQKLLDELINSNVKYTFSDIVAITKNPDGKIVWLEIGKETGKKGSCGLRHIESHAKEFADIGITKEEIPEFIMTTISKGEIVGIQNTRPIYKVTYKGKEKLVAIDIGSNGFVVGANPAHLN